MMTAIDDKTLWTSIQAHIQKLPANSPIPKNLYFYLQEKIFVQQVNIKISGEQLIINNHYFDLSSNKKLLQVFSIFLSSFSSRISRDLLVESIYLQKSGQNPLSSRQRECLNHNVIKLISRARQMAQIQFQKHLHLYLDWFPYDPCTQTWRLYNVREERT